MVQNSKNNKKAILPLLTIGREKFDKSSAEFAQLIVRANS